MRPLTLTLISNPEPWALTLIPNPNLNPNTNLETAGCVGYSGVRQKGQEFKDILKTQLQEHYESPYFIFKSTFGKVPHWAKRKLI